MEKKSKSEKTTSYREAMRDKDVGEFLNDQLYEHGMTNKGEMLSEENLNENLREKENKLKKINNNE